MLIKVQGKIRESTVKEIVPLELFLECVIIL